jgi:hypothetical protein
MTDKADGKRSAKALVAMAIAFLAAVGCQANENGGIDAPVRFENVENGVVYDRAVIDHLAARRMVLPDNAIVRRGAEIGKIQLFMAKRVAFFGHPPEPVTLKGARKYMGCATKMENNALVVATWGEWNSHKEGNAGISLVAIIPESMECEQRTGLSGEESAARGQRQLPDAGDAGYWYAPLSPAEGWTALPDHPDPHRTAATHP